MSNIVQIRVPPPATQAGDAKTRFEQSLIKANECFDLQKRQQPNQDYGKIWEVLKEVFAAMINKSHKDIGLEDGAKCKITGLFVKLIENIFGSLFCWDAYQAFKTQDGDLNGHKRVSEIFDLPISTRRIDQMSASGASDKRSAAVKRQDSQGYLNSNSRPQNQKSKLSMNKNQSQESKIGLHGSIKDDKNLFEACYDLAILILLRVIGGLPNDNQALQEADFNREAAQAFAKIFQTHTRVHIHKGQYSCYQSFHSVYSILKLSSDSFLEIFKEKGILNFLFTMMPYILKENEEPIACQQSKHLNLNSLIIGQGFQGQQQPAVGGTQQLGQGNQSTKMLNNMLLNNNYLMPLPTDGGNNNYASQRSPMNQQLMMSHPSKKEERKSREKTFMQKLTFNRAISEPPSANKNAVHPVTEDFNDQQNSSDDDLKRNLKGAISGMGTLEPVDEEDPKRLSKDGTTKRKSGFAPQLDKGVPPLQISHIQHFQQQFINTPSQNLQSAGHAQHPATIHSSSLVMTSYLNMPLGLFSTTMNHMPSHSKQLGGVGQNFKINFVPQTTIAKSRLTRRQMSMSRKHTQKFSSVSNFAQGIYGEEIGSRDQKSIRINGDYNNGSQERQAYGALAEKSTSQTRKGPSIPKLNINSITNEGNAQKIDTKGQNQMNSTQNAFNGQITSSNVLKSSNRSNAYSNQNFENQLVHAASRLSHQQMPQHPYQQSSTLMIKHQNTGQYLHPMIQPSGSYPNESEHNISVYDEMNASFIDDADIGGHTGLEEMDLHENAEEKLRQLAIQLGEACLTNDLAALISQKRDLELVKSARKQGSSALGHGSRTTKAAQSKYAQRSISVSYTNHEPYFMRAESKSHEYADEDNLEVQVEVQASKENMASKTRVIYLNLSYLLLNQYSIEEVRFLKQPIQALNFLINSKRFQRQLKGQENYAIENGITLQLEEYNEGLSQVSLMDGKHSQRGPFDQSYLQESRESIFIENEEMIMPLVINQQWSQIETLSEITIVFMIYQRFSFMNEDIIRAQIENELSQFAAKDKGIMLPFQTRALKDSPQQIVVGNNQIPILNLAGAQNAVNRHASQQLLSSFEQGDSTVQSSAASFYSDAKLTIGNPNIIWASNGIGFDVSISSSGTSIKSSASVSFQKDRIRRKLDVMLHSIDKKIKVIIHKQYQTYVALEYIDQDFAKTLFKELRTLNCYLGNNTSRIMLPQILEVILESLLMIKKALIDVSLKTSIFVIDFNKPGARDLTPDTLILANQVSNYMPSRSATLTPGIKNGYSNVRSPISMQRQITGATQAYGNRAKLIKTQQHYRKLFSEYLKLISTILSFIPDTSTTSSISEETLKLLNEVFVSGDEQWIESVKTYVISVFLSDICSSFNFDCVLGGPKCSPQVSSQVIMLLDELRGINLVNLDEQTFFAAILQTQNTIMQTEAFKLHEMAKKKVQQYLFCAREAINYFQNVMQFFTKAINSHFGNRHNFQKNKNVNSTGQPANDEEAHLKDLRGGANKRNAIDQSQSFIQQNDEVNPKLQKYWKQIVRRMLYNIMYLITPPNGLLSSYLQNNAINFQNMGIGATTNRFSQTGRGFSSSISPQRLNSQDQDPQNRLRNNLCPLNFQLTQTSLSFLRLVFDLPERFTKYAFINEELMLFYIRTHYISFVRLYNKNFSKKQQWKNGTSQSAIESKKRSMNLCKQHIQCLFSIAKNRSDDTRRKLFQFKIVQFLCQEIELEFECTTAASKQKRNRLVEEVKKGSEMGREDMKSQDREANEKQASVRVGPPIGVKSLNISVASEQNQQRSGQIDQPQNFGQHFQANLKPGHMSKAIPKLNIKGLGLSDIIKEEQGTKTQLEIDQLRQLAEEQKKKVESIQSSQRSRLSSNRQQSKRDSLGKPKIPLVPKLQNVDKLVQQTQSAGTSNQDCASIIPSNLVSDPLSENGNGSVIPQLSTQGLREGGPSPPQATIQPITQIQQPQAQSKKPQFKIPPINVSGLTLSEIVPGTQGPVIQSQNVVIPVQEEQKELPPQIPQINSEQPKKPALGFKIPALKIAGLGMSDIIPGTEEPPIQHQTQELTENQGNNIELPKPIGQQRLSLALPKLNLTGLGMSDIIQGTQGPELVQPIEEQKQADVSLQNTEIIPDRPIPIKPIMKFGIPLNIAGLTLSEIQPDTQGPILQQMQPSSQIEEEKEQPSQLPPPQPQARKSFVPKLKIIGLGLSEIIEPAIQPIQPQQPIVQEAQEQRRSVVGPNIPSLNVAGLGLSDYRQVSQQEAQQKAPEVFPPKRQMPPGMSMLNITGLGLSEIIPEPQQTLPPLLAATPEILIEEQKEELAQPPLEIQVQPVKRGLPFGMPKLKVEGLGLTGIIPDPPADPIAQQHIEEVKEEVFVPLPKKPMPFGVPKINVQGLGLSDLVQDTNDAHPMAHSMIIPTEEEQKQEPPAPPKRGPLPFMPKLKVAGLGFTDIIPDPPQVQSHSIPLQNDVQVVDQMVTINPSNIGIETVHQSIDFGLDNNIPQEELFVNRKQGDMFENTAPLKIRGGDEHERNGNDLGSMELRHEMTVGASAPQENRKSKKVLVITRNDPSDLSMKESIESAQFINFNNRGAQQQLHKQLDEHANLMMRASHVSNATALRVESILEGGASVGGSSIAPTPAPIQYLREERNMSTLNPTPNAMALGSSNFIHSPNVVSGRSKTSLGVVIEESKRLPLEKIDEGEEQKPVIRLNMAKIRPLGSSDEMVVRQPSQSILKKPQIPSLMIPAKVDQPEGKDKIMMQIAYSQQLNDNLEAGDLTKLQDKLNKNNVKFQVLLDNRASGFLIGDESTPSHALPKEESIFEQEEEPENYADEEVYYKKERSMRPIYQDEELHSLMISLIVCLLLNPERGTLDDLYCSQYPLDNGKQNILFLLHHHLNHPKNNEASLINRIMENVHKNVNPPLAGLRLLKLLCSSLFDISLYNNGKEWKKIAEGAYAKVYESKTNLAHPQQVAIKQLLLPKSIYDRCVLHDIFTEITCLEELRLEQCVSDLYDFGVDQNSYYIVMKRYSCSLRQWRLEQKESPFDNLSLYLSIYKELLKTLVIIHQHNITHYDIKCDNVFLDLNNTGTAGTLSNQFGNAQGGESSNDIKLTIGDFGECKIFSNEKDELCQRNRGTDFCKSPEMLQLVINTRKDTDKYDRRKQVGTNRLSDVWSAGCLLYELLTGEFLFYTPDYLQFHFRVTRPSEALFTQDKLDKISNNVYLIDFMKFMLVRDPRLRPSIENVLKRFEHVHALLVSGFQNPSSFKQLALKQNNDGRDLKGSQTFEIALEQSVKQVFQEGLIMRELDQEQNRQPYITKIMEDISLCNISWANGNLQRAKLCNEFTHIFVQTGTLSHQFEQSLSGAFQICHIPDKYEFKDGVRLAVTSFLAVLQILDYFRRVVLTQGKVLMIEREMQDGNQTMREALLIALSHIFQTNAYEAYTLIRSQNLSFRIGTEKNQRLQLLSQFISKKQKISTFLSSYPRFSCRCGSSLLILRRKYASYSNMESATCNCSHHYRNVDNSQCPSPGCNDFVNFMKIHFHSQAYECLQWGYLEREGGEDPFLLGPKGTGSLRPKGQIVAIPSAVHAIERMIASNLSQTIDENSALVSLLDKKATIPLLNGGVGARKTNTSSSDTNFSRWKLYKCKSCHVWTHAVNEPENRYAILLNNRIKSQQHYVNIKQLNQKQLEKTAINSSSMSVRVPILNQLKLNLPF